MWLVAVGLRTPLSQVCCDRISREYAVLQSPRRDEE